LSCDATTDQPKSALGAQKSQGLLEAKRDLVIAGSKLSSISRWIEVAEAVPVGPHADLADLDPRQQAGE
jgi:hypothetical protein